MRKYICSFGQHLWPPFKSVPQEIHFNILCVSKRLSHIAERVLYKRNKFLFTSAKSLRGSVEHVNQRTGSGVYPRTHSMTMLFLWSDGRIPGVDAWIRYIRTRRLVDDFPRLKVLQVGFLRDLRSLWEGDLCPVHPALVDHRKCCREDWGFIGRSLCREEAM